MKKKDLLKKINKILLITGYFLFLGLIFSRYTIYFDLIVRVIQVVGVVGIILTFILHKFEKLLYFLGFLALAFTNDILIGYVNILCYFFLND